MPQLMPLNWAFSSLMVSFILVSACVIYSEKTGLLSMENSFFSVVNKSESWFW
uniref:ATP synthase F0 subunit 8 n=1 Tax=Argiope amoena TaxID=216270 RepID=A0A060BJ42_9ARAC|nr:ATP synthase F0 subunit 8 [Argiope amoena]